MYLDTKLLASTPIAEATIKEAEAAKNIRIFPVSLSVAKSKVANCVLSPSSAINTVVKIRKIFSIP